MALAFLHNKRPGVAIVHSHNLVVVDSKLPTCDEDGYELRKCSCGDFITVIIPSLGHDYSDPTLYCDENWHWNKCAKCDFTHNYFPHRPNIPEEEVTIDNQQVCIDCGYIMKQIVPCDHVGERVLVSQPTCTEAGSWKLTCSICGEVITEEIPALGHQWNSAVTKQATCVAEGEIYKWCERCHASDTESIAATGVHTPISIGAVSATCTTTGSTAGSKCGVCNTFLVEPEILPYKGHTASGWITDSHHHWKKCVVCDEYLDENYGLCDKDGYGDLVIAATCKSNEIRHKACSVCGGQYIDENVIVPNTTLEHTSSSTVYHKDITETTHTYYRKCTMCGTTTVEGVRNHSWKTSEGSTYCTACGYIKTT